MTPKRLLRKQVRELKSGFPVERRMEESAVILSRVEKNPHFLSSSVVLLYHSLPDEVHTHDFVRKWSRFKQVLLPVVQGDELLLYPYTDDVSLKKGSFDIYEPLGEPFTQWEDIGFVLVPGVAFDVDGHRLGRGKGFYDRLLPKLKVAYRLGVCFRFQLFPAIPSESFDCLMDEVVSC